MLSIPGSFVRCADERSARGGAWPDENSLAREDRMFERSNNHRPRERIIDRPEVEGSGAERSSFSDEAIKERRRAKDEKGEEEEEETIRRSPAGR